MNKGTLGVVHKPRLQDEVGWSKNIHFCQRSCHRKCQRRGVGGQKIQNFVNVVCERPLIVKVDMEVIKKSKSQTFSKEIIEKSQRHLSTY